MCAIESQDELAISELKKGLGPSWLHNEPYHEKKEHITIAMSVKLEDVWINMFGVTSF